MENIGVHTVYAAFTMNITLNITDLIVLHGGYRIRDFTVTHRKR